MIILEEDREKALEAGWEALKERAPQLKGFQFDDFEVKAFKENDLTIGMLLIKGPELHVAILPKYRKRWLSKRIIKMIIGERLEKYGYAITSVMLDNKIGQDFAERLGFKRQSYSDGIIHYRMTP